MLITKNQTYEKEEASHIYYIALRQSMEGYGVDALADAIIKTNNAEYIKMFAKIPNAPKAKLMEKYNQLLEDEEEISQS